MKLYEELAPWWPLFSAPADYREEAAFIREANGVMARAGFQVKMVRDTFDRDVFIATK
jgi:hypothetical protein